jgi:D-alanyl-lipoteichoic acid acyltransferase DltB (MBOAT superfamily)
MSHIAFPVEDHAQAGDRLGVREYVLILVQLALAFVLVRQFHLEEQRQLPAALAVVVLGFAVHAQLPRSYRRPWFLLVSLGCLVFVLGPVAAGYAVAVGGMLIGATYLPIAFGYRLLLILALAGACVWGRVSWDAGFWTIVGSMFMFRMIVYLYSIRRERTPRSWWSTCSYFALLPNAFFPLFPVVDYKTFCDSYYNDDRKRIYQTGVHWIVLGVAHLLLYRAIRTTLLPNPLEIRTGTNVALFFALNYALYLRISGHFHLICGMLHLFGFNLPRTHDNYFLASSFSDIWRRINIYWKDFLMKLFFFPAFFKLRRWGNTPAVVGAVLWVFGWTWLAHSWQAFWLLGEFPLHAQNALLWLGVGSLVAISAAFDQRRIAREQRNVPRFSVIGAVVHALKVVGVFTCVSLFWTYWANPEIFQMLLFSRSLIAVTARDLLILGGALGLALLTGVVFQYAASRKWQRAEAETPSATRSDDQDQERSVAAGLSPFDRSVVWHLAPLIALLLLAQAPVSQVLGDRTAGFVASLQSERLTHAESMAAIAGYYEELNDVSVQAGPFLGRHAPSRSRSAVDFGDMIRYRNDLLHYELIPGWEGTWAGTQLTINRWGMRDRDRTLAKPSETYRLAAVGSSFVMGFGVDDEETFCRLVEDRLNATPGGSAYELLNFGGGRYFPIHRQCHLEHKVLAFAPDVVLYFGHQDELYSSAPRIASAHYQGIDLENRCLDELVRRLELAPGAAEALIQLRVSEHHPEILRCIYGKLADLCRQGQTRLIYVYLPVPGQHDLPFDPRIALSFAEEAGMECLDLTGWWGELSPADVLRGEADYHPNTLGHRLIADMLESKLREALGDRAGERGM